MIRKVIPYRCKRAPHRLLVENADLRFLHNSIVWISYSDAMTIGKAYIRVCLFCGEQYHQHRTRLIENYITDQIVLLSLRKMISMSGSLNDVKHIPEGLRSKWHTMSFTWGSNIHLSSRLFSMAYIQVVKPSKITADFFTNNSLQAAIPYRGF